MELDVIEVNNLVKVYLDKKEIALHTLCCEKGKYVTNKDHYPDNKNITLEDILSRQRKDMEAVGPSASDFFEKFVGQGSLKKYDYRSISGILALRKKYEAAVIDAACARAAYYGTLSYTTVKKICEKDLTLLPVHTNETYINEENQELARDLEEYNGLSELGEIQ